MMKNGKGKVINVASVPAFQGGFNIVSYTASKHGVAGLTKSLANDWASKPVNVNAIAPGYFTTELTEALQKDSERSKLILTRTPAGRCWVPEDVSGAALFLASSASGFQHGVVLPVH